MSDWISDVCSSDLHPVTEMITGLDLVEWQLRVAAGEALPLTQEQVPLNGHSIEVRLYAEEPEKGFLPSIGRLVHFAAPDASAPVRLANGAEQGEIGRESHRERVCSQG